MCGPVRQYLLFAPPKILSLSLVDQMTPYPVLTRITVEYPLLPRVEYHVAVMVCQPSVWCASAIAI